MSENDMSRKIKELRTKQDLTFEQIAQQVGVGRSTVRKWETGQIANMRRDKIAKLAAALHTTPEYLMGWADSETPNEAHLPNTLSGKNVIRIAARDGSYQERILSDQQLAALKAVLDQMPDVPEDL